MTHKRCFRQGSPIHWGFNNSSNLAAPLLRVVLSEPPLPIVYSSFPLARLLQNPQPLRAGADHRERDFLQQDELDQPNPLSIVAYEKRLQAWASRSTAMSGRGVLALPVALSGCDYCDPVQRQQGTDGVFVGFVPLALSQYLTRAHTRTRIVRDFCTSVRVEAVPGATALHLLGSEFGSSFVRAMAAHAVCLLSDENLRSVALMIMCAIRFEVRQKDALSVVVQHLVTHFLSSSLSLSVSSPALGS